MKKYFTKTHFEYVKEHFDKIVPQAFMQEKLCIGDDPTYNEYCTAILNLEFNKNADKHTQSYYNNLLFHLYQMKNNGEQIYYITPDLSSRLARTICNSDVYFLKSPYREIFVQIDPGLFYINSAKGDKTPVQGFYVYLRDYDNKKHIRVMASALLKPTPEYPLRDTGFYFHIDMDYNKILDELKIYINKEKNRKEKEIKQFDTYKNENHIEEFASFVFNTLLYITSKNPDVINHDPFDFDKGLEKLKSKAKKRKMEQQREKTTSKRIVIVGSHIKDRNKDIYNIKRAGGIGAWKLQHKVKVSAYWRMQWYGSKKDNTRHSEIIWIDSYEKGPEYAELISNKHIVK